MKKILLATILIVTSLVPGFAHDFTDISGHWAEDIIVTLYEQELVKGISATQIGPDLPLKSYEWKIFVSRLMEKKRNFLYSETLVTREDAVAYLYAQSGNRLLKKIELTYTDAGDINQGNIEAVKWASSVNLVKGDDQGKFMPKRYLTRAEAMTIIVRYKAIELKNNKSFNDDEEQGDSMINGNFDKITASIKSISDNDYELTVNWGEKPTGGYSIEIVSYDIVGNSVVVTVKTTSPGPKDMVTQAFTHPKANINIPKNLLKDNPSVTVIEQK